MSYKPKKRQWTVGPYGEAICKRCRRVHEEFEDPTVAVVPQIPRPEECPICNRRSPKKQAMVSLEGWMCRYCYLSHSRYAVGSFRCKNGAVFEVLPNCVARFTFGERQIPTGSKPSDAVAFNEQRKRMWRTVIENDGIARKAAMDCVQLGWFPYGEAEIAIEDYARKALRCAAVMYDENQAKFSTYAYHSCKNALMRYSKVRITPLLKKHKATPIDDYIDTRSETDAAAAAYEREQNIREAADALESIKHLLSEYDLECFRMKFVENMTYQQIGIHFGVRSQAIFLRIQRCQKRVAEFFA